MTKPVAPWILASLLTSYPDEDFPAFAEKLLGDDDLGIFAPEKSWIESTVFNPEALKDLASEYIDTFDRGRVANPIYETEYGRDRAIAKGAELADLAGFYKAFGLEMDTEGPYREMLDHVSVELEFYALLLMKQNLLDEMNDREGSEIVLDARKKFLSAHLGRFVKAISERPGVAQSPFYSKVFSLTHTLVAAECEELGVTPTTASLMHTSEDSEICCGTKAE